MGEIVFLGGDQVLAVSVGEGARMGLGSGERMSAECDI